MFCAYTKYFSPEFRAKFMEAFDRLRPNIELNPRKELAGSRFNSNESCYNAAISDLVHNKYDDPGAFTAAVANEMEAHDWNFNELASQALKRAAQTDWYYTNEKEWD